MVVEAQRLPFETLARAAAEVAASSDLRSALGAITRAAAEATRSDLAVLRVLDGDGQLVARAIAPEGSAIGAEVAGTRVACEAVAAGAGRGRPRPRRRARPGGGRVLEPGLGRARAGSAGPRHLRRDARARPAAVRRPAALLHRGLGPPGGRAPGARSLRGTGSACVALRRARRRGRGRARAYAPPPGGRRRGDLAPLAGPPA